MYLTRTRRCNCNHFIHIIDIALHLVIRPIGIITINISLRDYVVRVTSVAPRYEI